MHSTSVEHFLQKINLSGGFYHIPNPGVIRITGEDRIDFIQRQSSNDLRNLNPNHVIQTTLTSPTARILDVLITYLDDDALVLITLPGFNQKTAAYLNSRIFFMDKVSVVDESHQYIQTELFGPALDKISQEINLQIDDDMELVKADYSGLDLICLPKRSGLLLGSRFILDHSKRKDWEDILNRLDLHELIDQQHKILRTQRGIPAENHELTEEYTPLETGLENTISSTKGCYTGQEILARQITYDKVTKRLVGVKFDQKVNEGQNIFFEGQNCGIVTSVADHPELGIISLGIMKRPFLEPGQQVQTFTENASINGTISSLPFI